MVVPKHCLVAHRIERSTKARHHICIACERKQRLRVQARRRRTSHAIDTKRITTALSIDNAITFVTQKSSINRHRHIINVPFGKDILLLRPSRPNGIRTLSPRVLARSQNRQRLHTNTPTNVLRMREERKTQRAQQPSGSKPRIPSIKRERDGRQFFRSI